MQSLFKFVTYSLVIALIYMSYTDYLAYHELHSQKTSTLTDLPVFNQIYWVPLISAFAIFAGKK